MENWNSANTVLHYGKDGALTGPDKEHAETSMLKTEAIDFAIFPLSNPGIVSIPLAFLLGWIVSVLDKRREDPLKQSEMEVRSLTGLGAEKAVQH